MLPTIATCACGTQFPASVYRLDARGPVCDTCLRAVLRKEEEEYEAKRKAAASK